MYKLFCAVSLSSLGILNETLLLQVRLLGYCVEDSLFLVYEFIDNGNLSQHLRSSGTFIFAQAVLFVV